MMIYLTWWISLLLDDLESRDWLKERNGDKIGLNQHQARRLAARGTAVFKQVVEFMFEITQMLLKKVNCQCQQDGKLSWKDADLGWKGL